ncbi:MAG: SPFH domain-containing protein, partial [Pirellulaceae bacterium]
MAEANRPETQSVEMASDQADPARILSTLLWLLGGMAVIALGYSLQAEAPLIRAAAMQLALAWIVVWGARGAERLRQSGENLPEAASKEARSLHLIFLAGPLVVLLVVIGLSLLGLFVEVTLAQGTTQIVGGAITAILSASLWTAVRRPLLEISAEQLPEVEPIRLAIHEARVVAFVVGLTLLATTVVPAASTWVAQAILIWVMLISGEYLLRIIGSWFSLEVDPAVYQTRYVSPLDSLIREGLLSQANPVGAIFDVAQRRFGVSLRGSWTVNFMRRATFPILLITLMMVWLSTSLVVIQVDQIGLRQSLGKFDGTLLQPGLGVKLPWPLGSVRRVSTGRIETLQIGFSDPTIDRAQPTETTRALLWTQSHADEFSLVLGTQSELVAINAVVYYQVASDPEALVAHVYGHANPRDALEAISYEVLRRQTESATLDQVLSQDRFQFSQRIEREIQAEVLRTNLGYEVVDVALLSLHPPVEVAADYLEVGNAQLDAKRYVIDAEGDADKQLLDSQQKSQTLISDAKVTSAQRVGEAGRESAEFLAVGKAYQTDPDTYQLRLWFDALERVLQSRQLYVLDDQLPEVIVTDQTN